MQTRRMSFIESCVNVLIGYGIACAAQAVIFPWFGIYVTTSQHLQIGALFTVVSIARSYVLRRIFNKISVARSQRM
jgi:hypothetical protein